MPKLPDSNFSLDELQAYIKEMCEERGFADEKLGQKFTLLLEEMGEFAKAARKDVGIHVATDAKQRDVALEAADVLIVFVDLCNRLGISLEKAFFDKEKINQTRSWE